jgi:hypothetical protein
MIQEQMKMIRDIIRKVLSETVTPPSDKKYAFKTKEEKKQDIEKNREYLKKILPKIIKYFKYKFGDVLVDVNVRVEPYLFLNADYSSERFVVTFLFEGTSRPETDMNRAVIWIDLDSLFNLDLKRWDIPLRLETKSTTPKKR